jgi:hypothetical protein
MKRKYILIFTINLIVIFSGHAQPQSPITVAVYNFTGDSDATHFDNKVTTLLTADLTTETNLVLLERAELNKALSEQAFGISGLVSAEAAAKIGQITGAKILITGEIVKTDNDHLTIVADIIGTETGRLFAEKVQGAADNLADLTSDLSGKIAQLISAQTTNLVSASIESSADRLDRVIKNISGTNRPSVSINILYPTGKARHSAPAETELGIVLLKAGFAVVDDNSDRKPDVEITGVDDLSAGPKNGSFYSFRCVIELKVQDRRTGNISGFEHEEASATDATRVSADRAAQTQAAEQLAEKILPLLAK